MPAFSFPQRCAYKCYRNSTDVNSTKFENEYDWHCCQNHYTVHISYYTFDWSTCWNWIRTNSPTYVFQPIFFYEKKKHCDWHNIYGAKRKVKQDSLCVCKKVPVTMFFMNLFYFKRTKIVNFLIWRKKT